MMGVKIREFQPLPREVSLEELVPTENFYRDLEERLNLSFVREMVAPLYARGGRPSVELPRYGGQFSLTPLQPPLL